MVATDDREMNMLRPAAIRRWLNSSEIVFAGTTRNKTAVTLEILVAGWASGGFRMDVYSLIIHLPDFDNSISDWIPFVVQYFTAQMSYLSNCRCRGFVNLE